jgi:hypothetical protein
MAKFVVVKGKSTIVHRVSAYPLPHQPHKVDCDVQQMLRCFSFDLLVIATQHLLCLCTSLLGKDLPCVWLSLRGQLSCFIQFHYDICSSSTTQSDHISLEFTVCRLFLGVSPLE